MGPIKLATRAGHVITPSHFILASYSSRRISDLEKILRCLNLQEVTHQLRKRDYVVSVCNHSWERAVAYKDSSLVGDKWLHHLLLVDLGEIYDTHCVYIAPATIFAKEPFAAFEFVLDGLLPISNDGLWPEDVLIVVKNLLMNKMLAAVLKNLDAPKNGIFLGDVTYDRQSLSQFLIKNKYAVLDPERFAQLDVSCYGYWELLNYTENAEQDYSQCGSYNTADSSSSESYASCTSEPYQFDSSMPGEQSESKNSSDYFAVVSPRKTGKINAIKELYKIFIRKPPDMPPAEYTINVRESQLSTSLIEALARDNISRFFPVPANALPYIARGENVAVIGKGGKTLSSIYGVMDQLLQMKKYEVPGGFGPLGIFLCSGSITAHEIFKKVMKLAAFAKFKIHVLCVLGSKEALMKPQLAEGCHILITTPPCLVRLLRNDIWTNLKRLRWLIIDEADELLESPFDIEMAVLQMNLRNQVTRKIQYIVGSKSLTPSVWRVIKGLENHILIIRCYLEAALYAGVKHTVTSIPSSAKIAYVLDWMEKNIENRIVVVCSIGSEVHVVANALKKKKWKLLVAHDGDECSHMQLAEIRREWYSMQRVILICCDTVLNILNVSDATCLVHFSLPKVHKTAYTFRYSLLGDNFTDHYRPEEESVELKSLILLDDQTDSPLPFLVDLLQRLDSKVNPKFVEMAEKVRMHLEYKKHKEDLCPYVLHRGGCIQSFGCSMRHQVIPENDAADPRFTGEIVINPIFCENGTVVFAKILSSEDAAGNKHSFPDLDNEINTAMRDYFRIERPVLTKVERGTLCAIQSDEKYYRGKIQIVYGTKPATVRIRLIDKGKPLDDVRVLHLLELPEHLASYPPQSVKLFISGLLPIDFDKNYDDYTTKALMALLLKPLKSNQQWRCTVRFAFKCALVVENLRIVSRLPGVGEFIDTGITATDVLLKKNLVVTNDKHIPLLTELCKKANFPIPAIRGKYVMGVRPKWAHLAHDKIPYVVVSYVVDTKQIYVANSNFLPQLIEVEGLCQQTGEDLLKKGRKYIIRVGHLCLAKVPQGWNRAKVLKINDDIADCFMVDHGDIAKVPLTNIVTIPEKLVNKLPFQAVECILGGVCYSDSDEAMDRLWDLTKAGCFVEPERQKEPPILTKGPLYKVKLLTKEGESLNRILIFEGLLESNLLQNEFHFLEDLTFAEEEEEPPEIDQDMLDEILENYETSGQCRPGPSAIKATQESTVKIEPLQQNIKTISLPKPKIEEEEVEVGSDYELVIKPTGLNARILWHQQEKTVTIRVMVPGVREKRVWAAIRNLRIKAVNAEGARYLTNLHLFGVIDYRCIRSKITPSSLDVTLYKRVFVPWVRLTYETTPNKRIQYDPDAIVLDPEFLPFYLTDEQNVTEYYSEDEEDAEDFETFYIRNILGIDSDSE